MKLSGTLFTVFLVGATAATSVAQTSTPSIPKIPREDTTAGAVKKKAVSWKSAYNTDAPKWAKEKLRANANTPEKVDLGEAMVAGLEYTHTFKQGDCPQGYTIANQQGVDVVERDMDRNKFGLNIKNTTTGTAVDPHTANVREYVEVTPRVRFIKTIGYNADKSKYIATVVEVKKQVLATSKDVSTNSSEGPYRDLDSAKLEFEMEVKLVVQQPGNQVVQTKTLKLDVPDEVVLCTKNNEECAPGEVCPEPTSVPTAAVCGNGVAEYPEECDDGALNGSTNCNEYCAVVGCGNSFVELGLGESCDDGNSVNGDGCDSTCVYEAHPFCSDNIVESPETCDDGNLVDGDGCSSWCGVEVSPTPVATIQPTP